MPRGPSILLKSSKKTGLGKNIQPERTTRDPLEYKSCNADPTIKKSRRTSNMETQHAGRERHMPKKFGCLVKMHM